jgi:3-hydroxyisobutyrate dehydrogenase
MPTVALLGTGLMGREMALRLLGAGHRVTVYNRTPARARALVEAGATLAPTPAAAVRAAEAVVSVVADDTASRAVWLGPAGALAGSPAPGAIAVESATVSRAWVRELAVAVRAAGLGFLDGPVTGGPDGARAGSLTVLAGGDAATLRAAWPVLSAYAARAVHLGPVGCGTAYKLVVNLMGAAQATALAEGLLVAERLGLDMARVAEALCGGAVASPLVRHLVGRMLADDHDDVYFAAMHRLKDARYGLALAREVGQATPTLRAAAAVFERAVGGGAGAKNSSVVIDVLRRT